MHIGIRAAATVTAWALASLYQPYTSTTLSLTVNNIKVPIVNNAGNYFHGHFQMTAGTAAATIETLDGSQVNTISISPKKYSIQPSILGNKVSFTLPKDGYYIVKVNSQPEVVILADPPEDFVPPSSGAGVWNVKTMGADGTGTYTTTTQFTQAINWASGNYSTLRQRGFRYPQAIVYVPAGVYLVRNIILKSNVAFYLAPGAVLRFTAINSDYTHDYYKSSQGRWVTYWIRTEHDSRNIKMFGRGIVDGNGYKSFNEANLGNALLVPIKTTDFYVDGITFRNSAAWAIQPIATYNLFMKNVKVLNRLDMGENDGFDVMHSRNATIRHSIAISLDDPYSTKCWMLGKDISKAWPEGSDIDQIGVVIDDSISWTRCFGYKVGQGVMKRQQDITFSNGVVYDAAIGLGVNHKWGTDVVSGVTFRNMDIESTGLRLENRSSWEAVFVTNGDNLGGGNIQNVKFENIRVRQPGQTFAEVAGWDHDTKVSNVLFKNILMPGKSEPAKTLIDVNVTKPLFAENLSVSA